LIVVDQPVECDLHGDERSRCLREFPERHRTREVFRDTQDPREHRSEQQIRLCDHGRSHQLPAQPPPAIDDLTERVPHQLLLFALVGRRNRSLARFAYLIGGRQQLRFGLAFQLNNHRQSAADHHHRAREYERVDSDTEDQIARHRHFNSAEDDREAAADIPEHTDEYEGGQCGVDKSKRQIDRRVGGNFGIVGDTIFGVLVFAVRRIEAPVTILRQPAVQDIRREPLAPFALGRHPAPYRGHRQPDAEASKRYEDDDLAPENIAVPTRKRVEKIAIPVIQPVLHRELGDADGQEANRQGPARQCGLAPPKARRARPEPGKAGSVRIVALRHRPSPGPAEYAPWPDHSTSGRRMSRSWLGRKKAQSIRRGKV